MRRNGQAISYPLCMFGFEPRLGLNEIMKRVDEVIYHCPRGASEFSIDGTKHLGRWSWVEHES